MTRPILCVLLCGFSSATLAQTPLDEAANRSAQKRAEDDLLPAEPPPPEIDESELPPAAAPPKRVPQGKDGLKPLPSPKSVALPKGPDEETPRKDKATPALLVTQVTDADLSALWESWRSANASQDVASEQKARAALVRVRSILGNPSMERWSMALIRAARIHAQHGDAGGAIEIGETAVTMAPALAPAWSGLAEIYFRSDPTAVDRSGKALLTALRLATQDGRYRRALFANAVAVLGLAWALLAVAFFLMMLLRRARYVLYDFHLFFPRSIARWQSALLFFAALLIPLVFRMGLVPWLLVLFLSVTLYITWAERLVGAVLLVGLTAMPVGFERLVAHSAYASTAAEEIWTLEQSEVGSEPSAERMRNLVNENKASFEQAFSYGTWELRRGHLEAGIAALKASLVLRQDDAYARHNLGTALFIQGDLENPRDLYTAALAQNPLLAETYLNMGRLLHRRYQVYGEQAAGDVGRARDAFQKAQEINPLLVSPKDLTTQGEPANQALRLVSLPKDLVLELAKDSAVPKHVGAQLSLLLLGDVSFPLSLLLPLLAIALCVGLGTLSGALGVARACTRCGSAVSKRGAPELSLGSRLCSQCVNVFTKKNAVLPSTKVRKQLEIARHEAARARTTSLLGVVFSGMGHLFAGFPARGALFGFLFLVAVVSLFLRDGSLRTTYDLLPTPLRLVPTALILALVFPLSLRSLRKTRAQEEP
jgi:tetratricopeptide (TPR) repeat protein